MDAMFVKVSHDNVDLQLHSSIGVVLSLYLSVPLYMRSGL